MVAVAAVSNKDCIMYIVYNSNGTQHTIVEVDDRIDTIASQTHMTADELCSIFKALLMKISVATPIGAPKMITVLDIKRV